MKKNKNKQEKNQSPKESAFLYGKHVVKSLLRENKEIKMIYLQENQNPHQIEDIMTLVKQHHIPYEEVTKSYLDRLTENARHQGIVAETPAFEYASLDDCFQLAEKRQEDPFFVILDGIEDPHNLGSILRTAAAVGVHGVIIPKHRAVGVTGVVAKISTGAVDHVPIVRVTNITQTIESLKKRHIWVFATDMAGEDMRQWNSQGPIAIVIGNEGKGVSERVKGACDGIVTIPMTSKVQSLNASVAAAVLMYEVARNRLS